MKRSKLLAWTIIMQTVWCSIFWAELFGIAHFIGGLILPSAFIFFNFMRLRYVLKRNN